MTAKRERIETVLNRIRPLLQADGVEVELVEIRDNDASVRLTGLCVQCGTAPLNFHTGLEAMLREEIEECGELRLATTTGHHPHPAKADLGTDKCAKKAS
jgi:Fe-S cluster biogenesis protein NfuA